MNNEPLTAESITLGEHLGLWAGKTLDGHQCFSHSSLKGLIEAYAAQEVAKATAGLQAEIAHKDRKFCELLAERTAGKPITHNGKEYWPDANGWYEMECCSGKYKDGWVLGWGPHNYNPEPASNIISFDKVRNCWNVAWAQQDGIVCTPTLWQPLPAGPVMEGG